MQKSKIGVGVSDKQGSAQAGEGAARMALENMTEGAGWALAFCGGRHDPQAFLDGVRRTAGGVEVVGGSAVGVITNSFLEYSGYEGGVALFPSSLPAPLVLESNELNRDEILSGEKLGEQLGAKAREGDTALIFYDSVKAVGPPPQLNTGSRLLEGIYRGLQEKPVNLIGAGLVGDFQMSQSYVFNGSRAVKQAVVAALLPSGLSPHTAIMHGCNPVSSFMEITRVDGAVIYEIDGRRAYDVLMEALPDTEGGPTGTNLSLILTLGEKHGDLLSPYDESAYVNRLIVNANPEDGSVTLFEADFQQGARIQIMTRDNQLMLDSVKKQSQSLLDSLSAEMPLLALYINCAGRSSAFTGSEVEDASLLQTQLGPEIPLLGFYSGVELAPLLGRTRPLDWTGVLTVFT